jgi:hypothetical protein
MGVFPIIWTISLRGCHDVIAFPKRLRRDGLTREISEEESRRILRTATDIRPDENVHGDPSLAPPRVARARPVTSEESRVIMSVATDMRPLENFHPEPSPAASQDEPTQ